MSKKKVEAENPETLIDLKLTQAKKVAGGFPAIKSSLTHISKEVGIKEGMKVLLTLNQKGGLDCPGCAWPDPDDDRSRVGEYCENGAKAIAEEATRKKLTAEFFKSNSVADLSQLSDFEIGKKGRLSEPMFMPKGGTHYQAISWDAAFDKIATQLNQLNSPDEAIFYTSGRTSNEAAFLYQLFAKAYGTNNLPDCSNMCHESSGAALSETLGIGKGSVKLEDFYSAEVILIIGQNPGTNHPRMLTALQKAKRNGAKIISVNPIKEAGLLGFSHPQEVSGVLGASTSLSDHYLQLRINADMALFQLINQSLVEMDSPQNSVLDHEFIKAHTTGYEELLAHYSGLEDDALLEATGLDQKEVDKVVNLLASKKKIIACWAMGLTQHKNSVDTIKEVVNLLLLKGSIGKPGAGTCPVRGHSNVQGDRTMGIYEKPSSTFLDKLDAHFSITSPRAPGYDTVQSITAMHQGKAKVFFGMGGNFLSATPDTLLTAEAMQNCALTVQVSTKLNRGHLIHGQEALILPCLARTDKDLKNDELQFVSVENSMGVVHSTRGSLEPITTDLLSEVEIVVRLAQATLKDSSINWSKYLTHYDEIRSDIEQVIPGFDNYNERVRQPSGFYLPNCAREKRFDTQSKKAVFTTSHFEQVAVEEDEFLMMTIRSHDQFNTTIYGLDDRYRGIYNERRVILMNQQDMTDLDLANKQPVDIYNHDDDKVRVARNFLALSYDIPQGCVATYFPEANVLVPISKTAKKSNTPASKSVVVKIFKR